jgi:AraC family transcriptional regulator
MTTRKPVYIDRATEKTTATFLPCPPLLSSTKFGWDNVFLEYHYQPSGEHEEICAAGDTIAIFTKVGDISRAERTVDGHLYRHSIRAGEIIIIPADVGCKTIWEGESEFILVGLNYRLFPHIIDDSSKAARTRSIPQIAIVDPLILQMGLALYKVLETNTYSRLYVDSIATALLVHLRQYYSSEVISIAEYCDGLAKRKLERVIDYIDANLDRDLGLQELANIVCMSPRYFAELFKKSTGLTPHQYIIALRVDRAKKLLLQEKLSIADIAYTVGFANQSHLNLHFKRLVGVTPKQFSCS